MDLIIATRNRGKLLEFRELLPEWDIGCTDDWPDAIPEIEETGSTFEDNAILKALAVAKATNVLALADDSGLEVSALGGRPGVISARYAGPTASDEDNNNKLLQEMMDIPDGQRQGQFTACLAVADIQDGKASVIRTEFGHCQGSILKTPRGTGGFGYDPLFWVPQLGATFAELGIGSKKQLSHRAQALKKLKPWLLEYLKDRTNQGK